VQLGLDAPLDDNMDPAVVNAIACVTGGNFRPMTPVARQRLVLRTLRVLSIRQFGADELRKYFLKT